MIMTIGKTGSEAGGTFKEPRLVSIDAACSTEKVESWARQQLRSIVLANIGKIFRTIFTSSTSFMVHCRDGDIGLEFTALFKGLKLPVKVSKGI